MDAPWLSVSRCPLTKWLKGYPWTLFQADAQCVMMGGSIRCEEVCKLIEAIEALLIEA